MRRRAGLGLAIGAAFSAIAPAGHAQSTRRIALAGRMGGRALLVVDGRTLLLAPGEQRDGVRLLALPGDDRADVEADGRRTTLVLGAAPVSLGGAGFDAGGAREIVLTAGPGGHFTSAGTINGRPVRFMVDTGATVVAVGLVEAQRLGLDLSGAPRVVMSTANGAVAAHQLTLSAVTLGNVTVANVRAVVVPATMPHVLLGNSFLQRFQMRRENDVMRLELR